MTEDLQIDEKITVAVLANELKHLTAAMVRLVNELKQHREAVDERVDDVADDVRKLEGRLTVIETEARSNKGWLSWAWKLFGNPVSILIGFLILTYAQTL